MNHPAVEKAAKEIDEDCQRMGTISPLEPKLMAEIIERETKYSRLVEAATKLAGWFDADEKVAAELRSVLDEIKEG